MNIDPEKTSPISFDAEPMAKASDAEGLSGSFDGLKIAAEETAAEEKSESRSAFKSALKSKTSLDSRASAGETNSPTIARNIQWAPYGDLEKIHLFDSDVGDVLPLSEGDLSFHKIMHDLKKRLKIAQNNKIYFEAQADQARQDRKPMLAKAYTNIKNVLINEENLTSLALKSFRESKKAEQQMDALLLDDPDKDPLLRESVDRAQKKCDHCCFLNRVFSSAANAVQKMVASKIELAEAIKNDEEDLTTLQDTESKATNNARLWHEAAIATSAASKLKKSVEKATTDRDPAEIMQVTQEANDAQQEAERLVKNAEAAEMR